MKGESADSTGQSSMLQKSTKSAVDHAYNVMLAAGILTAGALPALAATGDMKTYSSFLNFLTNDGKFNFFLSHGYNMWVAWFGMGMAQITSTRYLKTTMPEVNMWMHKIFGGLMVVISSYFGV